MLFPGTFYYSISEKIFPRNKINAADSTRSITNTPMPARILFRSLKPVRVRTNLPQPEHPRVWAPRPGFCCPPVPGSARRG